MINLKNIIIKKLKNLDFLIIDFYYLIECSHKIKVLYHLNVSMVKPNFFFIICFYNNRICDIIIHL